jgi:hypothetical protein
MRRHKDVILSEAKDLGAADTQTEMLRCGSA